MNTALNKKKSIKSNQQAIKSAETVALFRAIGACDKDAQNPDYLAKEILSKKTRMIYWSARLTLKSSKRLLERGIPGGYWYFQARTRYIDDALEKALRDGCEQIVILGAGYDTRSYRFHKELSGARIFEVDFPGTQINKKDKLRKLFGSLPKQVIYVPVDFNSQALEDVLPASGYDSNKKTFFIWEGVSMYLPEASVNHVLDFVTKNAPLGSSIVFDYALRSFIEGDYSTYGSELLAKRWEKVGEPGLFGIEDGATELFLRERGFNVLSDVGPEELESAYTTGNDGKQKGCVFGCLRISWASLND